MTECIVCFMLIITVAHMSHNAIRTTASAHKLLVKASGVALVGIVLSACARDGVDRQWPSSGYREGRVSIEVLGDQRRGLEIAEFVLEAPPTLAGSFQGRLVLVSDLFDGEGLASGYAGIVVAGRTTVYRFSGHALRTAGGPAPTVFVLSAGSVTGDGPFASPARLGLIVDETTGVARITPR